MGRFQRLAFGAVILGLAGPVQAFQPLIQVTVSNPSKPLISGTTNLPDGTPLMIDITVPREDALSPGRIIYPLLGQQSVTVFTMAISPQDRSQIMVIPMIPASILLTLSSRILPLPDSVKPVLGEIGEKMGGPNVKQGAIGPFVKVRQRFGVR